LVYRKGADLLVEVIPEICRLYPNVSLVRNSWIYLFLCSYAYAALELLYQMDSHIQMLQTTISRHCFMGFPPLFKFFFQHPLPQM